MLGLFILAMLSVAGIGEALTTPSEPVSISSGETPISTMTYETGGGIAVVPVYPTPTTLYECWKVSDYGAGITGSIPVPTSIVSDGSIVSAWSTAGVQCYESYTTGGGWEVLPVPTAAANIQSPFPTDAANLTSRRLPLRVLLPSIIVPICSVAMIALAVVLMRRRVVRPTRERRWVTLKEEAIVMSEKKTKSTSPIQ